jgi:hypothetical protein
MKPFFWLSVLLPALALASAGPSPSCTEYLARFIQDESVANLIAESAESIVKWGRGKEVKTLLVSGASGEISSQIFISKWKELYPSSPPPRVLNFGAVGNSLLYKVILSSSQRRVFEADRDLEPYLSGVTGEVPEPPSRERVEIFRGFLVKHFPELLEEKQVSVLYLDSEIDTGRKAGLVLTTFETLGFSNFSFTAFIANSSTPEAGVSDSRILAPPVILSNEAEYGSYHKATSGRTPNAPPIPFPRKHNSF